MATRWYSRNYFCDKILQVCALLHVARRCHPAFTFHLQALPP